MTLSYLTGSEYTIAMNLGGSAVASHAEKKGMTVVEAYQVRSKKAKETGEINALKKEFPPIANLTYKNISESSQQVKLSTGQTANVEVVVTVFGGEAGIGITVNDSYSQSKSITDRRDRVNVALAARTLFNEELKKLPEGSILFNSPYTADGLGDERKSLYKRAGFGLEPSGDIMIGIKKGGKVKPITRKQIHVLQKLA